MNRVLQGDSKKRGLRCRLRSKMTPAENRLWLRLRARQFHALQFRRQHGIGPSSVDLYCSEKAVAIEVDGDVHGIADRIFRDQEREKDLQSLGLRIFRYPNDEMMNNVEGVLEDLSHRLLSGSTSPHYCLVRLAGRDPFLQRRGIEVPKD